MGVKRIKVKDFSLEHTLESGQFFRYKREGDAYNVFVGDKSLTLSQKGDFLLYKGASENFVKRLLGIDHDFDSIKKELQKDRHVRAAMNQYPGLRIMNYDPWECTIGFVCSANSNIGKIKNSMRLLSKFFGKEKKCGNEAYCCFPEIGRIDDIKKIAASKVGYRANYIKSVNKSVSEDYFRKLSKMDYQTALNELIKLNGVGEKVANCILLFAFKKFEAFPIDTHVKQIMQELYFKGEEVSSKEIREFARKRFGKYAGYAQQYLFHMKRSR